MLKNKLQKNIPDGWSFEQFGDIAKYEQPSKYIVKSTDYKDSGVPVLTAGKSFILGYTNESDGIYKKGDVVIFDDFTTTSQYVNFPFKVKSSAMKLLTAKDGISLKFIFGWMNIRKFKVGEHKRNYLSEYQYQDVLLPSLNEQKRIVAVLEVWDEMVEKLARKIEIKKNIKKGLMQELLIGKKRLSGFNKEWQEIKISKLGKTYSGITGKNKDDFGSGKPFISYMNIYSNSRLSTSFENFVDIKKSEKQNIAKYGDLFFTTSSETPHEVGISSVLLDRKIEELYLNSFCFGLRLNNFKTLIPEFSQFYFRGQNFRKQMTRIAQGATRFNLSKKYFLETKINIPVDIKEQKAIADILVMADREIEKLEEKLKIIKEQKKFLLNNLITGQIRVLVGNE